jgi:hypothetical protein
MDNIQERNNCTNLPLSQTLNHIHSLLYLKLELAMYYIT